MEMLYFQHAAGWEMALQQHFTSGEAKPHGSAVEWAISLRLYAFKSCLSSIHQSLCECVCGEI